MWAIFKHKLQGFFYGLMLGLLIGGGFFILKLDSYFKELNFYKQSVQKKDNTENNKEQIQNNNLKSVNSKTGKNNWPASRTDSVQLALHNLKEQLIADSANYSDTSLAAANGNIETDIIVKKDEMLGSKTLEIVNLSAVSINTNKDSLMQKVSGIRDDKNTASASLLVEFWQSPINYKGYKMSKNKIILFGMQEQDVIKLYKTDEGIYMRSWQGVYKLDFTNDFRGFDRINDESLLAKLK